MLEWVGCPPPGVLSNPRIEPTSLVSSALGGGSFTTSTTWEATRVGERERQGQREEGRREEKGRERKGQGREREGGFECSRGSSRKDAWRRLCVGLPSAPCVFLSQIPAPAAAFVSSQH